MNIKKVKALKYAQVYVDFSKITEGIYSATVPNIFSDNERLGVLLENYSAAIAQVSNEEAHDIQRKILPFLSKCDLKTEFLIDEKAVEFIGEALNAYFLAGLDKLQTQNLGDLEKSNLEYQVATSKELLKLLELTK